MAHEVETIAYAGKTPWHGLGTKVSDDLTPEQMVKAAGLDWKVEKQSMFRENGKKVPGKAALVRTSDDTILTVVGDSYKPVQNEEAFEFFDKFVRAGQMEMHTAGSLWNGRYVWGLAKTRTGFTVGKDDAVESYLLLMSPHVFGKAMVMQFTPIRVVCWNTLTFAIGSALRGKGNAFRVPHSTRFDDGVKEQALQALGLINDQTKQFHEMAGLFSKKRMTEADLDEFFGSVLKYDPKNADKNKDGSLRVPRAIGLYKEALAYSPGHDLRTAEGTLWGALNAVTFVCDHVNGRDRSTALKNTWLGHQATLKMRAFEKACELVKK